MIIISQSSKTKSNYTTKNSTYLGTLPFFIAVLISFSQYIPESFGNPIIYGEFKAKALLHSYSIVILSFISGIQWGISMDSIKPSKFLFMSNAIVITS
jgi:hypothetical protein